MFLVRSSLMQNAEKAIWMSIRKTGRKTEAAAGPFPPCLWDSAAWPLKTQVNQKLMMGARALVIAFSILMLLHNPQEGQTLRSCKATKHHLIHLQLPPRAVNVNTACVKSLFRGHTPHAWRPFSMDILLSPWPLQECYVLSVQGKVTGEVKHLKVEYISTNVNLHISGDRTGLWQQSRKIHLTSSHEISLIPRQAWLFSWTKHWGRQANALESTVQTPMHCANIPYSHHLHGIFIMMAVKGPQFPFFSKTKI